MQVITLPNDEEFLSNLQSVSGPADLCTPSGEVVGRFVPAIPTPAEREDDQCPYSDDDLAAMLAQPDGKGRPLDMILQELESR